VIKDEVTSNTNVITIAVTIQKQKLRLAKFNFCRPIGNAFSSL